MSEEKTSTTKSNKPQRSWLERLGHVLQGELQDREQLLAVLAEANKNNIIDYDALGMIEGVMQVSEMQVREIMIPRSQMVVLEMDSSIDDLLAKVIEYAHSRFPVVGESKDEVIGILLAKDLLPILSNTEKEKFNVRDVLRQAIFVPESKRLNVLLKEFRASRNHIAIVVDEYGGVAGLVTIEDVLEQIVGEIEDEHDFDDDVFIFQHSQNHATVKAITPLDEFNENFHTSFSSDELDTIGGLVMHAFGHVPKRGEVVELENIQFKILKSTNRRIHLLEVLVMDNDAVEEAGESADDGAA